MTTLAIDKMSWAEKLRTMEELWESLSREESQLPSPAWHKGALEETQQRYETGLETPVDWTTAKKELRRRSE